MPRTLVLGPSAEPISLVEAKAHLRVDMNNEDILIGLLIGAAREQAEAITHRSLILQTWEQTYDSWPCTIELPCGPLRAVVSVQYIDSHGVTQTLDVPDYTVDIKSTLGRVVPAYGMSWPSIRNHLNSITVQYQSGYAVPFTAVAGTDVITAVDHPYANGDRIKLSNSGGELPAGLGVTGRYYAVNVSGNDLKLSTTLGGVPIDLTGAGTGTHYLGIVPESIRQAMLLMIGHWYENRESINIDGNATEIPMTSEMLLAPHRVVRF